MKVIPRADCEAALASVENSETFRRSGRLRQLLHHIITESLSGNDENLLGKNLAHDLFGMEAVATEDLSAVRVEVGRLRRRLHEYYETEGKSDPVVIDIPKGSYVPSFKVKPESRGAEAQSGTARKSALLLGIGVVAVFLVAAAIISTNPRSSRELAATAPKVAILPFSNATGQSNDAYLANGFTTELIVAIAQAEDLVIVSRAAAAKAKTANLDVKELGEQLSAQYILLGSIRKNEKDLTVTAELSETATGNVVWAEKYKKPLESSEGFETAAEIANQVAQTVAQPHGVVYSQSISRLNTTEVSSYQCVLKAYDYERKRGTEYHSEVRDCLEETVEKEPEFATAWLLLSAAYLDEHRNGYNRLSNPLERAMIAAQRAVQYAPEDARSQWSVALVHFFQQDMAKFLESAERALKYNPNDADMIANVGFKMVISGTDWERGIELMDRAMDLSPAHPPLWHFPRALYEYRKNDFEASLAAAERINIPKLYMYHMFRAMALGQLGRMEEAKSAADEILRLKADFVDTVHADLRRRSVPDDMIEHMVNGLTKAGLPIRAE